MFLFNIAFFILCIYVGIFYGSISIRYADILLFSTILLLGTLYRNIYANLFQLFTIVIVCPYYFHYFFYSDRALFKLDSFLKVFMNCFDQVRIIAVIVSYNPSVKLK